MTNRQGVVRFLIALTAVALPVAQSNAQKTTFYVGTCAPGKPDFITIQQAVANAPAGATINVCPGSYAEQIMINQPLTLQGVTSGNSANPVIVVPASGLVAPGDSPRLMPQINVINATGVVNINNITIDATGNQAVSQGAFGVGVFCDSSSCALNRVVIEIPPTVTSETAIFAADFSAVSPTLTVKNSVIDLGDIRDAGISAGGISIFDIEGSVISAPPSFIGSSTLGIGGSGGTISGNVVLGGGIAVGNVSAPVTINGNTVYSGFAGISLSSVTGTAIVNNNNLVGNRFGVYLLQSPNVTLKGNQIASAGTAAIELNCSDPANLIMGGNSIINSPTGIDQVAPGFSFKKSAGTFVNVPTIEQLCQ